MSYNDITHSIMYSKYQEIRQDLTYEQDKQAQRCILEGEKSCYYGKIFGRPDFDEIICTGRVIDPRDPDFKKYIFTCTRCGNTNYRARPRALGEAIKNHPELPLTCQCTNDDNRKAGYKKSDVSVDDKPNFRTLRVILYDVNDRCYNTASAEYDTYGGRGVNVCNEWRLSDGNDYWRNKEVYTRFYEWAMLTGYQKGLQLDRKNNNFEYSPDNCTWATRRDNMNNQTRSQRVEFMGISYEYDEFERTFNLPSNLTPHIRRKMTKRKAAAYMYEKMYGVRPVFDPKSGMFRDKDGFLVILPVPQFYNLYPDNVKGPVRSYSEYKQRLVENARDGTPTKVTETVNLAELGIDIADCPHFTKRESLAVPAMFEKQYGYQDLPW